MLNPFLFNSGDNKKNNASIDKTPEWMAVLRRIVSEGHQIGTHTWRHLDQNAIGDEARRFEWVRNEMALHKILGFIPTYARAPYGNCNTECVALAQELGYHLINWSLSTNDFLYTDIASSQKSKDIVRDAYQTPKNYISLSYVLFIYLAH
jgi:peptidoglycan/xylan/chitin deacetylase (PgdA/CDA1 family)